MQKTTYGLSSTMLNIIFGAYGGFPGFLHMDYGHWYEVNGELVSADVLPSNKEALKLINQLYNDKVLDPEFVTGENTSGGWWAISNPFVNGQIGVTHSANIHHYLPTSITGTAGAVLQEFQKIRGADADVVFGPYPTGPEGKMGGFKRMPVTIAQASIYNARLMKDTEKLAAIFQIMDLFASDTELAKLALNGIEDEHYTIQEGDWIKATEGIDNAKKNNMGIMALRGIYGPENPINNDIYQYSLNSPGTKFVFDIKTSAPNMDAGYRSDLIVSLPSESKYSAEVRTFRDETWLKIIQGTLPIDYYDEYVKEWYVRGGDTLAKEANEWFSNK